MSEGSNRALYTAEATNHGRGLYSPTSNRMLYALPALMSQSNPNRFFGSAEYATWDEATFRDSIEDALAAVDADTSFEADTEGLWYYNHGALMQAQMTHGYGFWARGESGIRRDRFLPSGISMAGINRAIISANMGGGQAERHYSGGYIETVAYNDFDATLNIAFTQSATAFADGSEVRASTPDATFLVSDINAAHVAASRSLWTYHDPAYGYSMIPPIMSIENAGLVTKLNSLTDDTYFYMWSWFSDETLDYLFNHEDYASFLCCLKFYAPTLRCL
jgi:hypothetical protein